LTCNTNLIFTEDKRNRYKPTYKKIRVKLIVEFIVASFLWCQLAV